MARHRINAERSAWKGVWEVGGWPTASHPFYEWGGIIVSPCRQSSTKLSPCLVSKEGSPQPRGPCMHPSTVPTPEQKII